jgi:GntR family transcriptional regulator
MLPFSLALRPGEPVVDQVVYAVTRAVVSGQLRPGDRFPSVRTLSQELKVNPNTAQRIVALLVEAGLLAVEPGIGTVVASHATSGGTADTAARRSELAALQERLAEPLVVEARRLGLGLGELVDIVRARWKRLDGDGNAR